MGHGLLISIPKREIPNHREYCTPLYTIVLCTTVYYNLNVALVLDYTGILVSYFIFSLSL